MEQNELQPQQQDVIESQYSMDLNVITAEIKGYLSLISVGMEETAARLHHAKYNIFIYNSQGEIITENQENARRYNEKGITFTEWATNEFNFSSSHVSRLSETYAARLAKPFLNELSFNKTRRLLQIPEEIWQEPFLTAQGQQKTPIEMGTSDILELQKEVAIARRQIEQKQGFTEELQRKLHEINQRKHHAELLLQEKDQQLIKLQEELTATENQAPAVEVVEKVVEVEKVIEKIVPTVDREIIERFTRELKEKTTELQQLKAEKEQTQQAERDAKALQLKLSQLNLRIKEEETKFDEIGRRTKNLSLLGTYAHDIKELLTNKLAPLSYMPAIREYADSRIVQEDLRTLLLLVQQWHDELLKELDQATYGAATPSKPTKGATITVLNANK